MTLNKNPNILKEKGKIKKQKKLEEKGKHPKFPGCNPFWATLSPTKKTYSSFTTNQSRPPLSLSLSNSAFPPPSFGWFGRRLFYERGTCHLGTFKQKLAKTDMNLGMEIHSMHRGNIFIYIYIQIH